MTAKFLTAIALVAFVLTSWAQQTNTNTDVHGAGSSTASSQPAAGAVTPNAGTVNGRTLFLRNCAHCHGANAHGDDGPDLHNLDFTDDWIANRIRKGKAGQMTAFAGKLQPAEIAALVAYVQSLK
jgi:mono/diheme cytochrome c family protein